MEKQPNPTRPTPPQTDNDPETNRENQDHKFPGYPHYPAKQDILDVRSDAEQADVDLENFSRATWTAARDEVVTHLGEEKLPDASSDELLTRQTPDPDTRIVMGTDADVTEEDLILLGDPDQDLDGGDDELLDNYKGLDDTDFDGDPLNEHAGTLVGTGDDLDLSDVPEDEPGLEDEENDYYSLGGDKDSLEDDQAGNIF